MHIDAPRTIAAIRALEPYTISWSNMPDYMAPQDFHRLARAISAPADTVHFMHRCAFVLHVVVAQCCSPVRPSAAVQSVGVFHSCCSCMQVSKRVKSVCLLCCCCLCVVSGCSMNWVKHVKGAFHLDWTLCCKEEALPKVITALSARLCSVLV